ncbi:MAG: tRNA 4-thiouridine(8) synthase ThiI [Lachnospiraceae bacterium]|nr:tRNA 4-thiouridine(8) synthase ThiI [Lachnospiraceae bacterium]
MKTIYLIKYAEIGVKGKNRYVFEDALVKQIRFALKRTEGEFEVWRAQGRIYIDGPDDYSFTEDLPQGNPIDEQLRDQLGRVFGIAGFCPVVSVEDDGFDKLAEEVVSYMQRTYKEGEHTFKVFARRARKSYPMESPEICMELGGRILDACDNLSVNVHEPEIELNVEVRERIFIYSRIIPGLGGMPIGSGGKAMLLLSGGIDSPVAGYMIAKRGVSLEAVYFHAPPYTSERAKQKVVDLAEKVSIYTGPIRLHVINFTDIQMAIYEKCPHDELTIIMRRYMMRIAEHIAKETECLGLVTGESIGQVASQTMQSLLSTNEVCTLPVYRPLIAFDKQDIVDVSEKIDTYETSILPYEDCCTIFVAKHPVTRPDPEIIRRHEGNLSEVIDELMEKALTDHEVIRVHG